MAHFPAPHCSRWAATFTDLVGDALCEMTFAVQSSDDSVNANPAGFAALFNAAVVAHLVPVASSHVVFTGSTFEDVSALPYGGNTYPMAPTPGTAATTAASLPNSNCIAIKRIGGGIGRSARGRVYWPIWCGNVLTTANTVDATYLNGVVAGLTAFQAALTDPTGFLAVLGHLSEQIGKTPRNPMVFYATAGWVYADLVIDDQRRRLPGRGQ